MGDEAGRASAQRTIARWNEMLDALAEYQSGRAPAEDVVDKLSAYVVAISTWKIGTDG